MAVSIQVLYFDGCPNVDATLARIRDLAGRQYPAAIIETIEVTSQQEADQRRFLGSPTIRIDGIDIDPAARNRTDFGVVCRLYGSSGVPPADMIVTAIRAATE